MPQKHLTISKQHNNILLFNQSLKSLDISLYIKENILGCAYYIQKKFGIKNNTNIIGSAIVKKTFS